MEQITAITFDFGGTLAYGELDKEQYWKALTDFFQSIGYSGGVAKINISRLDMLDRLRIAQMKNMEIRFDMLCSGLMFDLGLHPTKERLDFIEGLYTKFFRIEFVQDVKELLEYLSERYDLSIVSNAISNVSRFALKKLGLEKYFDYVVLSHDLCIRKPDPEIFNFVLHSWGIESKEVVHIGDSLENDVQGGKNAGMKTVWIRGKEKIMNIHPDFEVSKIIDLKGLF